MNDEYRFLTTIGAGAKIIEYHAQQNELNFAERVKIIRNLFGLTLEEARDVLMESISGESLNEYENKLLPKRRESLKKQ